MKRKLPDKPILRFLTISLFSMIAMWIWTLLNIYVIPTKFWMDTLFGVILILLCLSFSPKPPETWLKSKLVFVVSLGLVILAIIIGIIYAFFYNGQYATNFILVPLHQLNLWVKDFSTQKYNGWQLTFSYALLSLSILLVLAPLKIVLAWWHKTFELKYLALKVWIWWCKTFDVEILALKIWKWCKTLYFQISKALHNLIIAKSWRVGRLISTGISLGIGLIILGIIILVLAANLHFLEPILGNVAIKRLSAPPSYAYISAILITNDGNLFIGTSSGVFRSKDNGQTWQQASKGITTPNISDLVFDSSNGNIYVDTYGYGVFHSLDGGETWQKTSSTTVPLTSNNALAIANRDGSLYTNSYGGVSHSIDGGQTWHQTNKDKDTNYNLFNNLVIDNSNGVIYASSLSDILHSVDGGQTWEKTNTPLGSSYVYALTFNNQNNSLYVSLGNGVFSSQDNGQTWHQTSTIAASALAVDNRDGTLYAGNQGQLLHSQDNGQTWKKIGTALTNISVNTMTLDSHTNNIYASTYGGVFRSDDNGLTWIPCNIGITNKAVNTLVINNRDGSLFAGTNNGGVFRSLDGGQTWQQSGIDLSENTINTLIIDDRDGTLYAGTYNVGVYRSQDNGKTWKRSNTGLPGKDFHDNKTPIDALAINNRDGTLYAGVNNVGVYRSQDNGQSWQESNTGLTDLTVNTFTIDNRNGNVYVGTKNGLFRSQDNGQIWKPISMGSPGTNVKTLVFDSRDGILFAGTNDGVFRSQDDGQTWNHNLTGLTNTFVNTLVFNSNDDSLYVSTFGGGVFRSDESGQMWQQSSNGLTNTSLELLAFNSSNGNMYANIDGDFFRSLDGGQIWQPVKIGFNKDYITDLAIDNRNGVLYAGTFFSGVIRSQGNAETWQQIGKNLINAYIKNIVINNRDGSLYALMNNNIIHSQDNGQNWKTIDEDFTNLSLVTALTIDDHDGSLYIKLKDSSADPNSSKKWNGIFRSQDGGRTWQETAPYFLVPEWVLSLPPNDPTRMWFLADFDTNVFKTLRAKPSDPIFFSWDATILEIIPQAHQNLPVVLHDLSAWTQFWLIPYMEQYWNYIIFSTLFIVFLYLVSAYFTFIRALKISIGSLIPVIFGSHIEYFASKAEFNDAWITWQRVIQTELTHFGDVVAEDLLSIPLPFRSYALARYTNEYEQTLSIQTRGKSMRLLNRNSLRTWNNAWQAVSNELGKRAGISEFGREQVQSLAQALSNILGFTLGQVCGTQATCAWQVEAPTLRLNIPLAFPLIFIADPHPTENAVRTLLDAISVLKNNSYFALVVSLEPENPDEDIPQSMRRAIDASPYAHDFVILSCQDVLEILMARSPEAMLVKHINRQVDLSFISPFIVNGPVPRQMFVGRDKEIRNLVDHAGMRNFAVVGNRKIGKTSLLNQVENQLIKQEKIQIFRLDCQAMRSITDFYTNFESLAGLQSNSSLHSFATQVRLLSRNGLQILFMLDEVDALLSLPMSESEGLLSNWRELANENTCTFLFCGSKVLGRHLRDPESVMFNFPETIALPYLRREEIDEVISRPLKNLGILMQGNTVVLDTIWELTSGHPNLTQYVGKSLVNAANARKDRTISQEDVEALWLDADFVQFYFDTIWGAVNPLEKLITLLAPTDNFTVNDVESRLANSEINVTPRQVDDSLEMLQLYAIFNRQGKQYKFNPRAFHRLLELNYDSSRLIASEKEKLLGRDLI